MTKRELNMTEPHIELLAIARNTVCDPANGEFLVPLENPELEETAQEVAQLMFSYVCRRLYGDNFTTEETDLIRQQCRIHARQTMLVLLVLQQLPLPPIVA